VSSVPSPNITAPNLQVSSVPSPNITAPNLQVSSVPSPNITAPNPQASSLIPQTTFNPNSTQTSSSTLNSNFNANPQQSLTDLMSEAVYNWPNQIQPNQDLFFFPGFEDPSRKNDLNIDADFFSPEVRFSSGSTNYFSHS
jgi:hypothetical protein